MCDDCLQEHAAFPHIGHQIPCTKQLHDMEKVSHITGPLWGEFLTKELFAQLLVKTNNKWNNKSRTIGPLLW